MAKKRKMEKEKKKNILRSVIKSIILFIVGYLITLFISRFIINLGRFTFILVLAIIVFGIKKIFKLNIII